MVGTSSRRDEKRRSEINGFGKAAKLHVNPQRKSKYSLVTLSGA